MTRLTRYLLWLFLLCPGLACAAGTTQHINTLPANLRAAGSDTTLSTFAGEEDADRTLRQSVGFVHSGGTGTGNSLNLTVTAVDAMGADGHYIQQEQTVIALTNTRRSYLFLDSLNSRPAEITFSGGTGCTFLLRSTRIIVAECAAASSTPTPSVSLLSLLLADTSGGSVTAVKNLASADPTLYPQGLNLRAFKVTGDGTTNDAARIQDAIDRTATSAIWVPCGTYYLGTTTIELKVGLTIRGEDYTCAEFVYAGTGDAFHWTTAGAVNGSGYGRVLLENIRIRGTGGVGNTGAGIDLVGGYAFFAVNRVQVTGQFRYGIIADQTEVFSIKNSIIENGTGIANSANIWLVSGSQHTGGASELFTNVITIADNQLNNATVGIIDDGGNKHSIRDNNFNGHSVGMWATNCTSIEITGNSFESALLTGDANIRFSTVSGIDGVAKLPCYNGVIRNNTFAMSGAVGMMMLAFGGTAFHSGFDISGNIFGSTLGRSAAIDVTRLSWSFAGHNTDRGTAAVFHYTGIHNDSAGNVMYPPGGSTLGQGHYVFGRAGVDIHAVNGIRIGAAGTQPVSFYNRVTAVWDAANVIAGSTTALLVTVTGAQLGYRVLVAHDGANLLAADQVWLTGKVSAVNTVRVVLHNDSAGAFDMDSGNLYVDVIN